MYLKMLVKDYKRKKVITIVLFAFMLLAATLAAAGSRMFLSLTGAMDTMFRAANTPHYMQIHNGPYDEDYVRQWTQGNPTIKEWSAVEILDPGDVSFFLNGSAEALDFGKYWTSCIAQNEAIDLLLTLENEPVTVQDGQIALPLLFAQRTDVKVGDTLTVSFDGYQKDFTVSAFVRDPILGGDLMDAKRLVLSEHDCAEMKRMGAGVTTAFSFVLHSEDQLSDFAKGMQSSDMPQNSFFVDRPLILLAYGISSGIVIALVLLCSILLVLVAFLTLRYTILSTIEEDFREIGVMKAIGFKLSHIIRLYLSKYILLSSAASVLGLILGQLLLRILNANILLYLGAPTNGAAGILASAGSVILILAVILMFCLLTLRRIGKMTVIDAIRAGNIGETYSQRKWLSLSRRRRLNVNFFIGLKEVLIRLKTYTLLFIVYLLCAFICVLPTNVKNTFAAPESMQYTGMPVSDIIGYVGEEDMVNLEKLLSGDADITEWALYTAEWYKLKHSDGTTQIFRTFLGDQTLFPPHYSQGTPPRLPNEIALSHLLAQDIGKAVGDSITLEIDGKEQPMLVSGIFPDVSDGGRSMRSCLEQGLHDIFYRRFHINVNVDAAEKVLEYRKQIGGATFSTLQEESEHNVGEIVRQLETISLLLIIVAVLVSALITALFIKMLTAKETSQVAVMKSLGFAQKHIRTQYFTRVGLILAAGIVAGMLLANIAGERIISLVFAALGAPVVYFMINPAEVYAVLPLILLAAVLVTALLGCRAIRKISISQINAE